MGRRLTRQEAIRTAGVMGASAFVGGAYLGDAAEAWAMHPKFNSQLHLDAFGNVHAAGPNNWDVSEYRAMILFVITQDSGAWAQGSCWTFDTKEYWAGVTGNSSLLPLKKGPAQAWGFAVIWDGDETIHTYPWEVDVTLV